MVMIMFLFLGASCATYHFGVPDKAIGVPAEFGQTEVAIAQAEQSQGAKYCQEKIARAKELAKKGVETYWACRTKEALGLLAEARQLAKEAEGCQPPPPFIEKDSDKDGVPDSRDKCPGTPAGVTVDKDGCPFDSDKDGVPDYLDKCPGTPALLAVDKAGCPFDNDKDGVPNYLDNCSETPAGVAVDKDGCPFDFDKDGVPDYLDKCPGTPAGVTVDKDGCPFDSDKDGVLDYLDKCPETPAGVIVDKDGCPFDSDKDGVPNYLDKCPGTPAGVAVDKDGCPLDSDKDGVPDYLDKCPGTPAGVTVDKDGCPPPPAKVIDKMTLRVLFDSNKATLTETDVMELQKAVAFVKKYPGANIRIDGYTDSIGTDAYNLKLSERRATAVMDYLIKEAGVESSKITAIGHGESDPVADNKTKIGRAKNRRVEVSILSD
jgi:outer membrane protein OmpA-like peptidoglycan-associated protein